MLPIVACEDSTQPIRTATTFWASTASMAVPAAENYTYDGDWGGGFECAMPLPVDKEYRPGVLWMSCKLLKKGTLPITFYTLDAETVSKKAGPSPCF